MIETTSSSKEKKRDYEQKDQHELFLMLSDLERQRREQAFSSINAKSLVRLNSQRIKTYQKQLSQIRVQMDIQSNSIQKLKELLREYIVGIEAIENVKNHFEEYKKAQTQDQKQLEPMLDKSRSNSESSVVYKHINEIPSDPSQSSNQNPKINKGAWTEKERYKYFQFIDENRDIFDNIELRYKEKIFVQLSKVIGTRTTKQCRCFHNQLIHRSKQQEQMLEQMKQ